MNPHPLKEHLREAALALGFDAAGFTRLDLLDDHTARLKAWVRAGRHATLGYLAHTARSRGCPAGYAGYAWCRSVVVVARAFAGSDRRPAGVPAGPSPPPPAGPCPVARYARGRGYHGWMHERLAALAVRFEQELDRPIRTHAFCDTSALPEKRLAVEAGLGWQGRHTLLITPRWGSWVVLGGLLLDVDLPPDARSNGRCPPGCRACLDACPTAALDGASLDARRCLSFWTTGTRRPAPADVLRALDGRTFGCDTCQEACPFNRDG